MSFDPYLYDRRPVVSVVLASGSLQGRLVSADPVALTIENRNGEERAIPTSAVEGLFPLGDPDPRVWGKKRPRGPEGRHVLMGAEG